MLPDGITFPVGRKKSFDETASWYAKIPGDPFDIVFVNIYDARAPRAAGPALLAFEVKPRIEKIGTMV